MARNSAGAYSLPTGQPVVTGTTISSATHNTLMSDIAAEIEGSLSRDGKGAMRVPLELTDGTAAQPSLTFDSDVDTGLYRVGANEGGASAGGARVAGWSATGWLASVIQTLTAVSLTLKSTVANGASAVAHIFDTTNALSTSGAKIAAFKNNAVEKLAVDKDGGLVPSSGTLSVTGAVGASATEAITPTMGTDWPSTGVHVYRSAGLVHLNFTTTAGASSAWTTILTLPAGSRPPNAEGVYFFGFVSDSSGGTAYFARFRVATSGVLSAQGYDDGTSATSMFAIGVNDTVSGAVTFPVV